MSNNNNRKKRFTSFIIVLLVPVIFILFPACNEKPGIVGYDFLTDTVEVYPLSSRDIPLIVGHNVYKRHMPIFNAGTLLLGRTEDPEGLNTAYTILRFSNFPDTNKNVKAITGAVLYMHPLRYAYGDSVSNKLSFNIYRLMKIVTQTTSCDSLDGSYYDASRLLGNWEGEIEFLDTIPRIEIPFDTSIVRDWLVEQEDVSRDTLMNGIFLVPNNTSSLIRQFSAGLIGDLKRNRPMLKVYYLNGDGNQDSMITNSANDISIVCTPPMPETDLAIQGAVAYWTDIEFDVSVIPPLSAIHKADFEIYINESASRFGNYGPDKRAKVDFAVDTIDSNNILIRSFEGSRVEGSDRFLFPHLASAVEIWNRRGIKGKLTLRGIDLREEQQQMDRIFFYGLNEPDVNKQPKLRIIYSKRPSLECKK